MHWQGWRKQDRKGSQEMMHRQESSVGSWESVLLGNSGKLCRTDLSYSVWGEKNLDFYIATPICHWQKAALRGIFPPAVPACPRHGESLMAWECWGWYRLRVYGQCTEECWFPPPVKVSKSENAMLTFPLYTLFTLLYLHSYIYIYTLILSFSIYTLVRWPSLQS